MPLLLFLNIIYLYILPSMITLFTCDCFFGKVCSLIYGSGWKLTRNGWHPIQKEIYQTEWLYFWKFIVKSVFMCIFTLTSIIINLKSGTIQLYFILLKLPKNAANGKLIEKTKIWKKCNYVIVSRNYLTSSWPLILTLFCISFFGYYFFMEMSHDGAHFILKYSWTMLENQYLARKWSTTFSVKNTN